MGCGMQSPFCDEVGDEEDVGEGEGVGEVGDEEDVGEGEGVGEAEAPVTD